VPILGSSRHLDKNKKIKDKGAARLRECTLFYKVSLDEGKLGEPYEPLATLMCFEI
jgi:hypothetical protein